MQILLRLFLIASILSLTLTACGPSIRSVKSGYLDRPEVQRALSLFENARYAEAADMYLQLANTAPPEVRNTLILMRAESLLRDNQSEAVQSILDQFDPATLSASDHLRYQLVQAEKALSEELPALALSLLDMPVDENQPIDLKQRYFSDKAQAYRQLDEVFQQVLALEQLDLLLDNREIKLRTQLEIINNLSRFNPQQLQQLPADGNLLHKGWEELSHIARSFRHDPQQMLGPYREWQDLFPDHPALPELLNNYLNQQSASTLEINQIAVLLPLSGKYAAAANAIRDGMMMAWYASPVAERPGIRFYDASRSDEIWPLINRATDEGADVIVGPLIKESVMQLARAGKLPVPVLALNQVVTNNILPINFYQYSLSPEDEARQVADWAWSKNLRSPAVLSPVSDRGYRLQEAFTQRWNELSGEQVVLSQYNSGQNELATAIQSLLLLNQSNSRRNRLQRLLGRNLKFTPRRRADTDFIFAIGNSTQVQQIKPLLAFYFASSLPVFSTSGVWNGTISHQQAFDIKGVSIPDIPWLVTNDESELSRAAVNQAFPNSNGNYIRLYPMGQDAYRLLRDLRRLENSDMEVLAGATGTLYMDQNRNIKRRLTWIALDEQPEILGISPRTNTDFSPFGSSDINVQPIEDAPEQVSAPE